jgi:8-oxo-dGTP pyrophosphatase MutT (NUDIX family)
MIHDSTWKAFGSYKPRNQKVFGVIAISKDNRVLLVKGRDRNKWSFPKGHYKSSEGELECALRECYEETGISYQDIPYESFKKLSSGGYYIYRGTEELTPIIGDSKEISEVAWVSIPSMMNMRTNIDVSTFLKIYKSYMC